MVEKLTEKLRHMIRSIVNTLLTLSSSIFLLLFAAVSSEADSCRKKFGELVDFEKCPKVQLASLTVTLDKVHRPDPRVAVTCWEYRASSGEHSTSFKNCHTGRAGGVMSFELLGKKFFVGFDVEGACESGHVFFDSFPGNPKNQQILKKLARLAATCRADREKKERAKCKSFGDEEFEKCAKSILCTLEGSSDKGGYRCRSAVGACENGFLQSIVKQSFLKSVCESKTSCRYLKAGDCWCPPDQSCYCGGGSPPRCVSIN